MNENSTDKKKKNTRIGAKRLNLMKDQIMLLSRKASDQEFR